MQLVMHFLKARTAFPRQCDNSSVWLKSLCLQRGMPYKRRWHDMTGFLASIWNNSLEKARGKAASPCCSNCHPPLGLSISDSLACACLLEHVLFHSVSKHIQEDLQLRFHCESMTRHGASTDQVLRNHWLRRVPHPFWHPQGCLPYRAIIYLTVLNLCPSY